MENPAPPIVTDYRNEKIMIQVGEKAPSFKLDDHLDQTISSDDLYGKKNVMLLFYPLDFTPT